MQGSEDLWSAAATVVWNSGKAIVNDEDVDYKLSLENLRKAAGQIESLPRSQRFDSAEDISSHRSSTSSIPIDILTKPCLVLQQFLHLQE